MAVIKGVEKYFCYSCNLFCMGEESSDLICNITLFAFDKDEEIRAHTSPGDAMIQILDGEALINIDKKKITAITGQVVVMPANVPHSVCATTQLKMILTVAK